MTSIAFPLKLTESEKGGFHSQAMHGSCCERAAWHLHAATVATVHRGLVRKLGDDPRMHGSEAFRRLLRAQF